MNRAVAGIVVAVLAVTAGCSGLGELGSLGENEHPLAEETVDVVVDGTPRERALTVAATEYWNENALTYAGFNVTFEVVPGDGGDAQPDIVVTYTDSVTGCGDDTLSAGCAPRPNASTGLERPADVRVKRGLANDSTVLVAKHEFGHLLGLRHDDKPQSVMYHERELTTRERPNATERDQPWDDVVLTVAARNGSLPAEDHAAYQQQVAYALSYFREGADGAAPPNLSVTVVEDPSEADVVITPVGDAECRDRPGSCSIVQGADPDDDGAPETYSRVDIELQGVDIDAVSWHVARQIALAVGIDDDELPAPLTTANPGERRGQWHG